MANNRTTTVLRTFLLALLLVPGVPAMAADVEEPQYELLDTLGSVELRLYSPGIKAVTPLADSRQTSNGFRRLAGYIFGGNATGESIAMTAPVQETLSSDQAVLAFTMPAAYSLATLPAPVSEAVTLHEVPQRLVAALPFGGWATAGKVKRKTAELLETLEQSGARVEGAPVLNQYNPPWTPPFLRRNEIEVQLAFDYLAAD